MSTEPLMTPSLHLKASTFRRPLRAIHRAFTLIEMLVVMGIILLLIALLLPAVERAYRDSVRTTMAADLQVISQAIDNYRSTFGNYPQQLNGNGGAAILCWSLIAPGPATADGADGPGFRVRGTQGTVYGPYLSLDRFHVSAATTSAVIYDRYDHPILYFVAHRSISPTTSFVGAAGYYHYTDSNTITGTLTQKVFQYRLGDSNLPTNGVIDPGEVPILTPYILWSAGPDGAYGPQTDTSTAPARTTGQDDDVTYPVLNPVPAGLDPNTL